jgi:hypothetical protein
MVLVAGGITEVPRPYPFPPLKETKALAALFDPSSLGEAAMDRIRLNLSEFSSGHCRGPDQVPHISRVRLESLF